MTKANVEAINKVALQLRTLRVAIHELKRLQTSEVHELSGHQTVDSKQSLLLSFDRLDECMLEAEETLATIAEAISRSK